MFVFQVKFPARRHVFFMVIFDVIALSQILKGVHGGQFRSITVNVWGKYALEACTYILIPEILTVAAVLETHDNAMTS